MQISEISQKSWEGELSRDAYTLLAQANLLRMRGCWPDAIEKCMAALKLAPEHPSAQSLLGDIYENQGRLDDAIQWYRMALDVQPDSPADKVKLAHLLERKARAMTPVTSSSSALALEESSLDVASPFPHLLTRRIKASPETLLRRAAFAAGAAALLIVLVAVLLTRGSPLASQKPRELNVPAVVVPAVSQTSSPEPQNPAAPVPADPAEQSLLDSLQASSELANQGITISSVQTDPRANRLTLTALCQPDAQTAVTRSLILRDGLHVVQVAARTADPRAYSQFTVRCLLASGGGGSTPLVFTADASRPAIAAEPTDLTALTDSQVLAAFSSPWWSPAVPQ
jgi:hypothetical protein